MGIFNSNTAKKITEGILLIESYLKGFHLKKSAPALIPVRVRVQQNHPAHNKRSI